MNATIIDANNLIHKVPEMKKLFLKDKESAQISLVETVKSRMRKNEKAIFVFDGHSKFTKSNVLFSEKKTADEVIRKLIEENHEHKHLKIVSSDRGITDFAKVCGCAVQTSESFWNELSNNVSVTSGKNINQNYIYDKLEKPERMSKREIDEFKKYFT